MGRESRDGGCRTSPLLVTEDGNFIVSGDDGGGGSSGEVLESGGDSAATAVLVLSTLVTVCASYTFGAAVGYSSPAESGIMADLDLSVAEYSMFGSIMTIGGMIGALFCGKLADLVGRRGVSFLFSPLCLHIYISGWIL